VSLVLVPRRRSIGNFAIGSWSWSYLLDMAGPVVPGFMSHHGHWYRVVSFDRRWKDPTYPELLGDSGRSFYVRASEARHLAAVARNWAAIQETLPEENRHNDLSKPDYLQPFPQKVRDDWPPLFRAFADWAERSGGFTK
jgi:hypothetical protein